MLYYIKHTLLVITILYFSIGNCNNIKLSDQAKISVITCGTGNELYSLFGHTGIRVFDPEMNLDLVYNYGAFDFSAPNFYGKFLKGDLLYFIGVDDFRSFLFNYQLDNRSVWEQPLNISQSNKQAIYNELASTYGTKKALYTYKFIDKNCTTLAVDLIQNHVKTTFNLKIPEVENKSNRVLLNEYLQNNYVVGLGINLLFGFETDKKFNHIFLPDQFLKSIPITSLENKPINSETITHFKANENNSSNLPSIIAITAFFIVLGLLCMYKWIAFVFYLFLGFLSLFLFGMQFYSFHNEVYYNYNLLLINPLFLLLAYLLITNQIKKYKSILKIIFACLGVYLILVVANSYLFMVFPIIIGISLSTFIQWKLSK